MKLDTLHCVGILLVLSSGGVSKGTPNTLQITYPPAIPPSSRALEFQYNDLVPFAWTSTWPNITLQIYQGPDVQGRTPFDTLLDGVSSTMTTFNWSAHNLRNFMTKDSPFYLYLFATNHADAPGGSSNSTQFHIRARQKDNDAAILGLGLGVGLGVGIPGLAALVGMAIWLCLRNRGANKTVQEMVQAPSSPPEPSPVPITAADHATGHAQHQAVSEMDARQASCVAELPHDTQIAEVPGQPIALGELEGNQEFLSRGDIRNG